RHALGREEWRVRVAGVVAELPANVLDVPPQQVASLLEEERLPLPGPGAFRTLAAHEEATPLAVLPVDVTDPNAAQLRGANARDIGELAHHVVAGSYRVLPRGRQRIP